MNFAQQQQQPSQQQQETLLPLVLPPPIPEPPNVNVAVGDRRIYNIADMEQMLVGLYEDQFHTFAMHGPYHALFANDPAERQSFIELSMQQGIPARLAKQFWRMQAEEG